MYVSYYKLRISRFDRSVFSRFSQYIRDNSFDRNPDLASILTSGVGAERFLLITITAATMTRRPTMKLIIAPAIAAVGPLECSAPTVKQNRADNKLYIHVILRQNAYNSVFIECNQRHAFYKE